MIVSWRQLDSETMEFEVQASAAGLGFDDPLTWVAVGFSRDNDMGQARSRTRRSGAYNFFN